MAETITFPSGTFSCPCSKKLTHQVLGGAFSACAVMLNDRSVDLKPVRLAICVVMGVAFFDFIAGFANKELCQMSVMPVVAGDKGI